MTSFQKRFGHNTVALVETAAAFAVGITFADVVIKNVTESETIDDERVGSWVSLVITIVIAALLLFFLSWINNRKAKRWRHNGDEYSNHVEQSDGE
jgi:hypothetical protein